MDDEPKVQQLENRIDSLESTIEKMMPSRRDALKMGGAALAGGSLMAGTASAGTNQVGTIGSASQPVDIESEDINNADTVTTENLVVNGNSTGVGLFKLDQTFSVDTPSHTVNLNTASDIVRVVFSRINTESSGVDTNFIRCQVNGVQDNNYTNHRTASGFNLNEESFRFTYAEEFGSGRLSGELKLYGGQRISYATHVVGPFRHRGNEGSSTDLPISGTHNSEAGPITSLRFFSTNGVTLKADVFVRDYEV